jgi:hypothetical protein
MPVLAVVFVFAGSAGLFAQPKTPLMTKWAKDVDSNHPLPEYSRPQMVRKHWLNLNGVWEMQSGLENDPVPVGKEVERPYHRRTTIQWNRRCRA